MKKLMIMSALVIGGLGIKSANAQFAIRVNVNLGAHPVYAPAPPPPVINEPVYDDYYYIPEVEAYYSVGERCYYYNDGARWISAAYLPGRYHDFDWRSARRFEVRGVRPYLRHDVYRGKFGGYINRGDFYSRAYPNQGRMQFDKRDGFNRHDDERSRERYDNRGWNRDNDRNEYDRGENLGGYGQPDRTRGGYNQPYQNQGGYNSGSQPNNGRNQGGYNQPSQNQGGYSQPTQNQGGYGQPSQGQGQQGGGRGQGSGQGNGGGQGQPGRNGSQGNGNYNGGNHYAANQMGVIQDRGDLGRPARQ